MSKILKEFKEITKDTGLYPPLNNYSFFGQGSGFISVEFFGCHYDNKVSIEIALAMKDGDSIMLASEPKFKAVASEIFSKYLKNRGILQERLELLENNKFGVDEIYYEYANRSNEYEIQTLLETSKKLRQLMWHLNAACFFAIVFDKEICLDGIRNSGNFISVQELEEIWDKAITPSGISFDQKQRLEYLRLVQKGASDEEIAENMAYVVADYYSVKDRSEVIPLLIEKFGRPVDPSIEIENIEKAWKNREAKFAEWKKSLNERQQAIVDYAQAVIDIRDERKAVFSKGYVIWWDLMKKMFNEAGILHKLLPYVGFQELMLGVDYLKEHKDKIEKRLEGAIIINRYDGSWDVELVNYDSVKLEMIDYYNSKLEKVDGEEIKGKPGSTGVARGTVRIILNANKYEVFNEGDILVTGMTRPEYVPLMKKAGAIVTDEGGITCHAAIVSRELGIPSVISTKNATKVLKDGMEVEVDADNGVVKILNNL